MDLVLTGATGFVGSYLALDWLRRNPIARVSCLVRAADREGARIRLHNALREAAFDGADLEGVLARADAIPGDLGQAAWIDHAQAWMRGPAELVHCAAGLSFRESDRAAVWQSNVNGTAALLQALPRLRGLAAFNYVSTAYVAGDRQGDILESERARPLHFNNPYEESKWVAEGLVREGCAMAGISWRILRPSIVIAHSVTHRMSSHSGFYHVVDTLMQLGRHKRLADGKPVLLPVAIGTTLDLIPVDVVVDEIVTLIAAGAATTDQTFHITPADPLQLADVLQQLTPMSGMTIAINGPETPLLPVAELVMRRLRYYAPYFAFARRFDRRGTQAALGGVPYRLKLDELRGFVRSYLAQQEDRASETAA